MVSEEQSLGDLCQRSAEVAGTMHATVVLSGKQNKTGATAHSSALAASAHELEFTFGEGPTTSTLASGKAVLVSDVGRTGSRWPELFRSMFSLGIQLIWAFPLNVGVIRMGSLTLYEVRSAPVCVTHQRALSAVAGLVDSVLSLQDAAPTGGEPSQTLRSMAPYRSVVHQASGMIAAQLGCDMGEALIRLRALAYAQDVAIDALALEIVNRRIEMET